MEEAEERHLHAGYKDFGMRRVRTLCTCGFETAPVSSPSEALALLVSEHGARVPSAREHPWLPCERP